MSGERIRIAAFGTEAAIYPIDFLNDRFTAYLEACRWADSRFVKERKAQVVEAARVGVAIRRLEAAGFVVEVDESIRAVSTPAAPVPKADAGSVDRVLAAVKSRGLTPFPYQIDGIRWLASRDRGLLADQMGLGKTIQALLALPEGAPAVVVCPATLKWNWAREARVWRPEYRIRFCQGRGGFRWPTMPRAGDERPELVIVNYDVLPGTVEKPKKGERRQLPTIQEAPPGTVVIADEAHALKNPRAIRTLRFRSVSNAAFSSGGRVWLMTGTPLLNHPGELWYVLRAGRLEKIAFGSYANLMRLTGGFQNKFGGVEWGKPHPSIPGLLARVMLRRSREDVLPDLPVKTYRDEEVSIDSDTRRLCDEALAQLRKAGVDLERAIEEAKVGDVVFETISRIRAQVAIAKIPALLERVEEYEESEEPVVVFSSHRKPVLALGARDGWGIVLGEQGSQERDDVVASFQRGELKGIALTIRAGGIGITLTRAHHVVLNDLEWTPALNAQAEDRLCRIGQTRGVIVTRLAADHEIDQMINAKLAKKQALISATTEAKATRAPEATGDAGMVPATAGARVYTQDPQGAGRAEANTPNSRFQPPRLPGAAPVPTAPTSFREARTMLERWAQETLLRVAGADPDHASQLNGVGFSRFDGEFGHSLADQLRARGRLTEKQWAVAVRLATKYQRQAATPKPEGDQP